MNKRDLIDLLRAFKEDTIITLQDAEGKLWDLKTPELCLTNFGKNTVVVLKQSGDYYENNIFNADE